MDKPVVHTYERYLRHGASLPYALLFRAWLVAL
jgi:hypothetical protein